MNNNKKEAAIVTVTLHKCAVSLFSLTPESLRCICQMEQQRSKCWPVRRPDKDPCDLFWRGD